MRGDSNIAFAPASEPYQRRLKLVQNDPNEREVTFPLIVRPVRTNGSAEPLTTPEIVESVRSLAPAPASEYRPSRLQELMDAHGGAVHFKGLPIRSADDLATSCTAWQVLLGRAASQKRLATCGMRMSIRVSW